MGTAFTARSSKESTPSMVARRSNLVVCGFGASANCAAQIQQGLRTLSEPGQDVVPVDLRLVSAVAPRRVVSDCFVAPDVDMS